MEPVNGWSGAPTVADVGEQAALAAILPLLPASDDRVLGPGDDAAVVRAAGGIVVVTSDSLVEGPDFRRAWSTPFDLGWKLAAVNLADVAAMGARPTALVVALAVPGDTALAALTGLAEGIAAALAALAPGCGVEGGDLATSPVVTAVATAFGVLDGVAPVRRSGARPGDVLAVSGELGAASRGLRRLFRDAVDAGGAPVTDAGLRAAAEVRRQLRPRPPVADGVAAARAGATAMMDVSDGLAIDAARLAAASGVGIEFHDSVAGVLDAAEDHALLAAFPRAVPLPGGFRVIGRVVAGAGLRLAGRPLDTTGWDPFR